MTLIDLSEAKLHARITGDDEDVVIQTYLGAAEQSAADYLGRRIYADEAAMADDESGVVINPAIKAAVLLTFGHLYANREAVAVGQSFVVPMGFRHFLNPYRKAWGV